MHDFLITILLGLALFKIVDLLEEVMPAITRYHNVVTLVLALGGVWFLDYSMFKGFDIALRNADMGVWVTGLFVAGATSVWRAVFHWLGTSEGEEPAVRHMHSARAA
jgi:hypothetical protein